MPPEGVELLSHDQVLRNEEYVRLIGIFVSLGVVKVRFTGGEPLVRKGFIDIVSDTRREHPDLELCLTTNGTLLHDYINDLQRLNVKKLNISLDSLSRETYRTITAKDCFNEVIANIDRVLAHRFFDLKVNAVLFKETIPELDDFLEYFKERDVTLRFIEKMPFTPETATASYLPSDRLVEELRARGELSRNTRIDTNVAVMFDYQYRGKYPMRIGVIPPISDKFCATCNRLRITSDGLLKTCLHSIDNHDLKKLLRSGADDEAIGGTVRNAVSMKQECHNLDCWPEEGGCASLARSGFMSKIGG
jgi:cyclic pyranopterin phosphate synthase